MVNVAAIFSTLGNPNSIIPLAIKDTASSTGMTAGSFVTGKEEGQDRFIDEVGTEILWLMGIPAYKWIFDKTIYKAFGLDSKFDVRNLKNKDIFEKVQKYAPTEDIRNSLTKISKQQAKTKNIAVAKFFVSTGLAIGTYIGITKAKHHYTEQKIRKNLIKEHNLKKHAEETKSYSEPTFKGVGNFVQSFAFSPVKNMWLLDGAITTERLADSRTPQEFTGYAIKEASLLLMMYYVGGKIQNLCEKYAKQKYNKTIGLDARALEDKSLQKAFEDGTIEKSLNEFKFVKEHSDASIYEFLFKNPNNKIVEIAKQSDIITMYKEQKKWYEIFKKSNKTDKIDTRKFINIEEIKGIDNKLNQLYEQYKEAVKKGESSDNFFAGVKKLKRGSILMNIGTCITVLGVVTPAIMLLKRLKCKDDAEFQTKKEIREQLKAEGIIS